MTARTPRFGTAARLVAAAFVVGAIVVVALLRGDDGTGATATPADVVIAGFAFTEQTVTVAAGATVTWTNTDEFAHSVKGAGGSFASEPLSTGDTFTHTFDAAGTFSYVCGIHPSMTGTVVVTG